MNDSLASVHLSVALVTALVGTGIPIVVGLASHLRATYKGPLMIILNAISAGIVTATMADGTAVFSRQTLLVWLPGVLASLAAYYNIWKPHGITSSLYRPKGVGELTPGKLADVGVKGP